MHGVALANAGPVDVHAAHPCLRVKGMNGRPPGLRPHANGPTVQSRPLFRQDDDDGALRRLVGERGKLGYVGKFRGATSLIG